MKTPSGTASEREDLSSCCRSEGQPDPRHVHTQARRIGRILMVVPLFFSLSVIVGCVAVLTPMEPGANDFVASDEGLVLGRIHLTDDGSESHVSNEPSIRKGRTYYVTKRGRSTEAQTIESLSSRSIALESDRRWSADGARLHGVEL